MRLVLRDEVVPVLRQYFATHPQGLVAAYLFGSVARGDERPGSDVDVAVVLGRHGGLELADRVAPVAEQVGSLADEQTCSP